MYTINKIYQEKQEIKKSEFICTIHPVSNIDEINEILKDTRKKYYDATHNCYAYILGENGDTIKCSDDGEPSQTAGIVILDALRKNELTNVLAIVTRYFGGIKLGAGGLVRAYSSSTSLVLEKIEKLKIEKCIDLTIEFNYQNYNLIDRHIKEFKEKEKTFTDNIKITIVIPTSKVESLIDKLIEITKNDIIITKGKEESRVV